MNIGAGDGNRTHAQSLGSFSSTIKLRPLKKYRTKILYFYYYAIYNAI